MCMKIECNTLEQIQLEATNWLRHNADLVDGVNEIDYKLFLVLNPALGKFLIDKKFFIRKVFVNVGTNISSDEPVMIIPIDSTEDPTLIQGKSNASGSQQLVCSFFKIPAEYLQPIEA